MSEWVSHEPEGWCSFKNKAKKPIFDVEQPIATQSAFSKKVAFFQKDQLGVGTNWRKVVKNGF